MAERTPFQFPELLAQGADESSVVGFIFISLAYLGLTVVVSLSSRAADIRLIGLGLLTAVAAMGYASVVYGPGMAVAPMMMKLAILLVLGGIALRLFPPPNLVERDPETAEMDRVLAEVARRTEERHE